MLLFKILFFKICGFIICYFYLVIVIRILNSRDRINDLKI